MQFDTNKSKEHMLTYSQNLVYEKDFHCAWKTVVDVNAKSLKEAYGILAWNNTGHGDWYFRSNCLSKFVGIGCSYKVNQNGWHSHEMQWDFNKKKVGLFGQPLWWRYGMAYKWANNYWIRQNYTFGEEWLVDSKMEVPINNNMKMIFHERADAKKLWNDPKNAGWKWGVCVEFKM